MMTVSRYSPSTNQSSVTGTPTARGRCSGARRSRRSRQLPPGASRWTVLPRWRPRPHQSGRSPGPRWSAERGVPCDEHDSDSTRRGAERRHDWRSARRIGRVSYWLRAVLVVVAVAQRRLGPSSSATTSMVDPALGGRGRARRRKPALALCTFDPLRLGLPSFRPLRQCSLLNERSLAHDDQFLKRQGRQRPCVA